MPKCLPKNLIPGFEDTIRRATMSGMREATNVGREERGEAKFSIESILRFLDAAAIYTAARAKAEYLRPLWVDRSPVLVDHEEWNGWAKDDKASTHEPVRVEESNVEEDITSPKGFDLSDILRYRGTDQRVDGNLARRRTFGSNQDAKGRDAPPSDQNPRYIAEGGRLIIEGNERNPDTATSSMVLAPKTKRESDTVTLSDGYLNISLSEKKEETTLYLVDTDENRYEALHKGGNDLDTTAPDGDYTLYSFDHACAQMPVRFESVLVELASSVATSSLPDGDRMQAGRELFREEVQQYVAPAFDPRNIDQ